MSLWRMNISGNVQVPESVIEFTLKDTALCLVELGCTFITTPETKGSLFYPEAVHLCNTAVFN